MVDKQRAPLSPAFCPLLTFNGDDAWTPVSSNGSTASVWSESLVGIKIGISVGIPSCLCYVFEDVRVRTASSESTHCLENPNIRNEEKDLLLPRTCSDLQASENPSGALLGDVSCRDGAAEERRIPLSARFSQSNICAANLSYEPISSEAREHLEAG